MLANTFISQIKDTNTQMIVMAFAIPISLIIMGNIIPENNIAFFNVSPNHIF